MKRLAIIAALAALTAIPAYAQFNIGGMDAKTLLDTGSSVAQAVKASNMSESDEIATGAELSAQVMGAFRLVQDEAMQRHLNRVGLWIALQSSRPNLPWSFSVLDDDSVNAIAAPGGYIMITRGMLKMTGNEAELACVLGHEIAHVTRKHHLSVLQKTMLTKAGIDLFAAGISAKGGNSQLKQFLTEQGKDLAIKMTSTGLSRESETEADQDGVVLAAKAGYDPAACLSFMKKMEATMAQTEAYEDLMSTHPTPGDRVKDIQSTLGRLQGAGPGQGQMPPLTIAGASAKDAAGDKKKKK